MSSTPTPTPVKTPVPGGLLASWSAFVKAHEKMAIIVLAAFLLFHFYSSAISAWVHHDDINAAKSNAVAKVDDTQNNAIQQQLAVMQAQINAQSKVINLAVAARTQQTQAQVKTDSTLPLMDLATRWSVVLSLPPADFTADANSITVNDTAAHATVAALEQVPTLTANDAALTTEVTSQNALLAKQTDAIQSCNVDLTAEKKAHTDDVKALKAQNKKSWLRGFKFGVITGFIGGLFAGHNGL